MGRVDSKKKISENKARSIRKQKRIILIACEGNNKTEKTYFNNFENIKSDFNICYAKGNNTDPLKLVQMLIKEIKKLDLNLMGGDIAYLVFDTDMNFNKDKIINAANKLAKDNHIKVISSNPSIEIWFLLHYEFTTSSMTNSEVIKRIKKYYPKYEKNINIYSDINKNIFTAINRAKKLEKYQLENGKIIGTVGANPSTEMYKIVEELSNNINH